MSIEAGSAVAFVGLLSLEKLPQPISSSGYFGRRRVTLS